MKAWNDLENDSMISLYWTGPTENPTSHWYLNHGVKIERFTDGTIEINNVMKAGDNYEPVTDEERRIFERRGWLAGCYKVAFNTYNERIDNLNAILKSLSDSELDKAMARKAVLIKKRDRYLEMYHNELSL